jgi:hypothetical protein
MNTVISLIFNNIKKKSYYKQPETTSNALKQIYSDSLSLDQVGNIYTNFFTPCGTEIARGYNRVVIGDYGAYIEFFPEQINVDAIENKFPGEPSRPVKYIWMQSKDESKVKVYFQKDTVAYADYKPNMYYISPKELLWIH